MIDSKNRRSRANQTIAGKGISMVSFVQNLSLLYVFFFFFFKQESTTDEKTPLSRFIQKGPWGENTACCLEVCALQSVYEVGGKKIKMFSLAIDWVHLIVQLEVIYAAPAFVKIAGEQVSEKMKH